MRYEFRFGSQFITNICSTPHFTYPAADRAKQFQFQYQRIAWTNQLLEFYLVYFEEISIVILRIAVVVQRKDAARLSQSLDLDNTRHHWVAREVPLEEMLVKGYVLDTYYMVIAQLDDLINKQERELMR